ncbi:MAG: UvrD-helicase domain-containing protein [Tannerellaceae bacterium]|nr:UvrD-helicase domain-containing protein [Tannerellaceae bacterium]
MEKQVVDYLDQLNDSQRQAVEYCDGPELVIAGAGSGKTRVLTYKIAYLLDQGYPPQSILALTFTNKAAREMKERIASVTDPRLARRLWMGTFHSIFSRILRSEASRIGYTSNFTIYDTSDSKNLIRSIIKEMQLDDKVYKPGMVMNRISNAKNVLITWQNYEHNKDLMQWDINAKVPLLHELYRRYQTRCIQSDAMDFDDLLLQTNVLFRDYPEVLDKYRNFFRYILVDEYQDTNFSQHLIVQKLAEIHKRICVVGDDAQSIYSFRGANIDNILQFQHIYPDCKVFKLERNYRSTQNIVNAANSLIHKNKKQIHKQVYSEKEPGNKLFLAETYSDYEEGYTVASKIGEMRLANRGYSYADFAVLYRTNAQSRVLEEALRKKNIPYKIYGGLSFYQRKEIKDVIAYLRMIVNPHDEEALKRVINYPARGIGNTTLQKIITSSLENAVSAWEVINHPEQYALPVHSGTAKKIGVFRELILHFRELNETLPADEMVKTVLKESGIIHDLVDDRSVEGISKYENLQELLTGITEFVQIRREEGEEVTLADFLSEVSLLTDQDNDKDEKANKVTLMTVHAAKGLEFTNVFVVGMEEDLFPSMMSKDSARALEEERRLFYVALTRAEENCVITYAKSRFRNGKSMICSPSRFLQDIDEQYMKFPSDLPEREATPAFRSPMQHSKPTWQPAESTPPQPNASRQTRPLTRMANAINNTTPSPGDDLSGLTVGARVEHKQFGLGEVVGIEGSGNNTKATIEFQHVGKKNLLLKYARLTIID